MAAHLEGKGVSVLDMTGMSQKNGSVSSHVRIAAHPQAIRAQRIASGEADLVLGCDMLTAATHDALAKLCTGRTHAVINTQQQPIGAFARQPDWTFPATDIQALLQEALQHKVDYVDASRLATALTGDAISTNVFMLGFAYQKGLLPVTAQSLLKAMALNGVSVASNQLSFDAGRHAAFDLQSLERRLVPAKPLVFKRPVQLDEWIERHVAHLTDYQNTSYANRYVQVIEHVRQVERQMPQAQGITLVVAHSLFKLMAYKDEYEVARLFTCGHFETQLQQQFEGRLKLRFHLAPPMFSKKNSHGLPVKSTYGPWVWHAMKALAKFKWLRGTRIDPFGWTAERQMERQLIKDFVELTLRLTGDARTDEWQQVKEMLSLPQQIRGFGHVKLATVATYRQQLEQQLAHFYDPPRQAIAA
jgi:indolepyruvate ferredoxin oxidoreductase